MRMWLGSGSPSSIGTVGCVACGFAKCHNVSDATDDSNCNVYYKTDGSVVIVLDSATSATGFGIYLESDGGQATSCKCPDGYTAMSIPATAGGEYEPTSSGSSNKGLSKTIECKKN